MPARNQTPKPVTLTQISEAEYTGRFRPSPYQVVGDAPGGGSGTGPQGPQGIQGPQGLQGPVGPPGKNGTNGSDGAQGPQGVAGSEGVQGPVGSTGPAGQSVVIEGYVESEADLPDLTGELSGPTYLTMDDGHIRFWNGTSYTDGGQVRGPKGEDGAPGAQGPRGTDGGAGTQGPKGDTGDVGPTGLTGSQGPQGPQGSKGDTGSQGPQGLTGPQGPQGIRGETGPIGEAGPVGGQGPAGQGIPAGGTSGQVLVKSSGDDYATEWAAPSSAAPGEVGSSFTGSGNANSASTQTTFPVGNYLLFRVRGNGSNVAQIEIRSNTGSAMSVDYSSMGYSSQGSTNTVGRAGSSVSISASSWTVICPSAEHATFVVRDWTNGEVWEGTCIAPYNGVSPTAFRYRVRATRTS